MKKRAILSRMLILFALFCFCIFNYMDKINTLTKLKLTLPKLEKQVKTLSEKNKQLKYEIDQFENPNHLMEIARSPEFRHLKHPVVSDVLKVEEGVALKGKIESKNFLSK